MTLRMVTCPLCCQPGFNTSDALCSALISASTRKLFCPVCNEELIGLDKLTIHLFGHKTSIKNQTNTTNVQNSSCQSKLLKDAESSVIAPFLYVQSENGQLFALTPSSLVNQCGTVSINTQNYISNTNFCGNKFYDARNFPNEGKSSSVTPEFSSCKDLLTCGDFSEPFDEIDVDEPSCSTKISGEPPNSGTKMNSPTATQIDEPSSESGPDPQDGKVAHLETEHPKPLIPCDICRMGFSNKAILAVHNQLMHKSGGLLDESENGIHQCPEKSRKKPLTCSWCPATFNLKSSLMIHVKVTHPAQKDSLERKEAEKVNCPVCGKTFPKESTLNQHMKAAHGEKPWQCTVCSKSFTTKYFLRKHKRIHTGETPYECTVCHKVFTFQQSYHKHMLYHTDDKPYCCSHCGRLFKELSTLNNHERIHSGEKPFACETCGKCFRQRVSYLVHRRIHTGAMPYKCTACNKSFRYKISQRTHKCPEHPPGIVVKTQSTLVDRLQAVINQGESGGHEKLFIESTSHSTPPEVADRVIPSTSSQNPPFPASRSEGHFEGNFVNPANKTIAGKSNSGNGTATSDSDVSNNIQTAVPKPASDGALRIESTQKTNAVETFPCLFDCSEMQVAGRTEKQSAGEVDVFSMNLDSSPSECLGKLHISSNDYCEPQSMSQNTTKSSVILHPNLSFDNMEEVDLCNLFFDVP